MTSQMEYFLGHIVKKLGMGSPYYMGVWKVLAVLPTPLPAIN